MLSLFPRDVLDEIWDLIDSVSEGCLTFFRMVPSYSLKPDLPFLKHISRGVSDMYLFAYDHGMEVGFPLHMAIA